MITSSMTSVQSEGEVVIDQYQSYELDQLTNPKWLKHDKLYNCNMCDYQATQQSSLKKYKMAIHDGICYSCDQCEYTSWTSHLK